MEFFTNFLTLLGEHYALVQVACAELVAAVLLLSLRPRKRVRHSKTSFSDTERILLWELSQQKDEVCTLMRRSDLMPVSAVGDLEGLLGVDTVRAFLYVCTLGQFVPKQPVPAADPRRSSVLFTHPHMN